VVCHRKKFVQALAVERALSFLAIAKLLVVITWFIKRFRYTCPNLFPIFRLLAVIGSVYKLSNRFETLSFFKGVISRF